MSVPSLAERQRPGLSASLTGLKHPNACQSCSFVSTDPVQLQRWVECDAWDQPTSTVVVLCAKCAAKLIDPHPRLYQSITPRAPFPGVMHLCGPCRHRDGVRCAHPDLKANGGPGLVITAPRPIVAMVDGTRGGRRCGWVERMYPAPPTSCAGQVLRDHEP